jgi:replicative DNA helicase
MTENTGKDSIEIVEPVPVDPTAALQPIPYRLGDLLTEFDAFADTLEETRLTGIAPGPITGFERLDRELCGALFPGLHTIQGNTGAGKTAFALQIACSCGYPAVYVTKELSPIELLRRITARVTETPLRQLKYAPEALPAWDIKRRGKLAAASAPNLVIADATRAAASPGWIQQTAEAIRDRANAKQVLVVIDSLHSWADDLPSEEYERLTRAIASLRGLAAALVSPVLYISEQNRASNKGGRNDDVNAGAGNRRIEYQAETVLGLQVSDELNAYGERDAQLIVRKNRNGSPSVPIPMKFDGGFQRFREVYNQ